MFSRKDGPAIEDLLNTLVDLDPAVAGRAREAGRMLLLNTPPRELPHLEQDIRIHIRDWSAYPGSAPAFPVSAAALSRISLETGGVYVVRLASFHHNGYVREEAVRLLDLETSGGELPFLLLRVNDWVAQVRTRAQAAVEKRINERNAWLFLHSYYLVQNLVAQKRNDLGALHQRIVMLLRSDAARPAREAALVDADRLVRRAAFVLSTEAEEHDEAALRTVILRGLSSSDLWVRVLAARTARTKLYGLALREVLGQARGDRSIPVRREALLGFVDEHPELRDSLLDASFSLREMVRFYLRKKANLDFAAVYRDELARLGKEDPRPGLLVELSIAIAGLGETGSASDADDVELFTIDARPRVRRAAIAALGRLDAEGRIATLGAALADDNAGVARAALFALGPRLSLVGEEGLRRAYEDQRDETVKQALAATLAVWKKDR